MCHQYTQLVLPLFQALTVLILIHISTVSLMKQKMIWWVLKLIVKLRVTMKGQRLWIVSMQFGLLNTALKIIFLKMRLICLDAWQYIGDPYPSVLGVWTPIYKKVIKQSPLFRCGKSRRVVRVYTSPIIKKLATRHMLVPQRIHETYILNQIVTVSEL